MILMNKNEGEKDMRNILDDEIKVNGSELDRMLESLSDCVDDGASMEEVRKYLNCLCNRTGRRYHMPANILIKADSSKRACDFLTRLHKIEGELTGKQHSLTIVSESEMLSGRIVRRSERLKELLAKKAEKESERESERESARRTEGPIWILDEFENFTPDNDKRGVKAAELRDSWKAFCKKKMRGSYKAFAVCTDYDTANEKFTGCPDEELKNLLDIFFNFKVTLKKRTSKDVYVEILNKIKKEGFWMMQTFKKGLEKYVEKTYPESVIMPDEYIFHTYNLIMKNVYGKTRQTMLISTEMLPQIKENASYEEVSKKLDRLTGLGNVKKALKELSAYCLLDRKNAKDMALHFVFSGNAGTGKTTVARLMAEFLYSMGVISENKVIEVSADELMGRYIGDATRQVRDNCRRAYGGILFIDEAYSINPASAERNLKTYRQEGLSELMKEMENNRDKLVVIFAGYKKEMDEFMEGNPGLKSRIFRRIEFEDYSEEELLEIFKTECNENGYSFDDEVLVRAKEKLHILKYDEKFGNARGVRTMFHDMQLAVIESDGPECRELKPEHIVIENDLPDYEESRTALMELTGLENAKKIIGDIASLCIYNSRIGGTAFPCVSNMLFTGNPGTGKTTVARLFGNMLFAVGAVSAPRFVSINAYELNSCISSGVSLKLKEYCRQAMGGVLFIDEAYALGDFSVSGGSDAISTLLDIMENSREDIVIIMAGYKDKMEAFLSRNQGLKSRIPTTIHFEDYSPEELEEIFIRMFEKNGFCVTDDALDVFRVIMENESYREDFANARTVRNIFEDVYKNHAVRFIETGCDEEDYVITADDMPDADEYSRDHVQVGFV